MHLSKPSLLAAVAVAAMMPALPVHAEATASAELRAVQLQLVDLAPGDGITPSVTFAPFGASQGRASISFNRPGSSGSEESTFSGLFGAWSPGAASVDGLFGRSSASLVGPGSPAGSTLRVAGSATGPGGGFCLPGQFDFNTCFTASANFSASASPDGFFASFTLSPNTLMVLRGDLSISAAATGGGLVDQFSFFQSSNSDSASANFSMQLSGPGPLGNGSQNSNDGRSVNAFAFYDTFNRVFVPSSNSFTGSVAVSFTNLTNDPLSGNYALSVSASGFAFGDARLVPEPGTWALMLGGLAAVAALARRRRA